MELRDAQLRAVKWYIGDVEGDDPFWGDPKAYVTLNSLFFPGTATEEARAAEGKPLNPEILRDEERLCNVLRELLTAFRPLETDMLTYRVERFSDYVVIRSAEETASFTSTSTAGFLPAYQDRVGITLMRFHLSAGTPALQMAQVLPDYAKAEEEEVLLPPGLRLAIDALPLTEHDVSIKDAEGAPPQIFVQAVPRGISVIGKGMRVSLPGEHPLGECGVRVLDAIRNGKTPDPTDTWLYWNWKNRLLFWSREILRNSFAG